MFNIENRIKKAVNTYDFVGIVCDDGHEHTIKAFGVICGTPFDSEDELENQLHYSKKIAKDRDIEILTANSFEDAVKNDIIDEDGFIR